MTNSIKPQSAPQSLLINIMSGGITRVARAALQVFITPLLILLLGGEQYGLVAFSMTLQMLFFMIDQAMSPAIIREFGIMESKPEHAQKQWDIFHTFEKCSLILGVLIGGLIIICAPLIAEHWLRAELLNNAHITKAIRLMGLFMACQWPSLLYSSCFIGMHRQSILAIITVIISYAQALSALAVLYFWQADIIWFLSVQIVFAIISTIAMRMQLIKIMPPRMRKPRFEFEWLASIKHFAGGTFAIGITTALLTQTDKIFISKLAVLSDFSAYALSFNLTAQVAMIIAAPLMISIQPIIANLINKNDTQNLTRAYHTFSQFNALINFTFFGALAFYAKPLITLWLGETSPLLDTVLNLVPWIVIGTIINALNAMPYIVQIAAGWTRLKLTMNIVQVTAYIILLPTLYPIYGVMIGPTLWIALNLANSFIEAPIMHTRHLKGEYFNWIINDTLIPAATAFAIFYIGKIALPEFDNLWLEVLKACFVSTLVLLTLSYSLPEARRVILNKSKILIQKIKARGL